MELFVDRLQSSLINVRIDLRRRDIGVAQHLLHDSQVRPVLQQMRREAVAKRMRSHGLFDPRLPCILLYHLPERLARKLLAKP